MTSKILVALDGSKTSESILPYLESLLTDQDADVTLVTVNSSGKDLDQMAAQGYLKGVAERLRRKGAKVDVEVLSGRPAEVMAAFAAGGRFDFLALCSRGRNTLKRMLFGSVAEGILRTALTPVLVVPPAGGTPGVVRRILLPLDGSPRSASVLKPAAVLAKAFGAKLCFVTVTSSTKKELPVTTVAGQLLQEQKDLQKAGLEVEVAVLYGDPLQRILTFAEENKADLIALTTHGRTGLDKVVFGNVAESLLRKCRLPLLVVRNPAAWKAQAVGSGSRKSKPPK